MSKENRNFDEPSVLDFLKSKLSFGRGPQIEIPELSEVETDGEIQPPTANRQPPTPFPWVSLIALALALAAQRFFEPPNASVFAGITFYLSALGLLVIAVLSSKWTLAPLAESSAGRDPLTFRRVAFFVSIPFMVLAFLTFSGNMFTGVNLAFWFIALALFVGSLRLKNP